jgi:uncharacterized protein
MTSEKTEAENLAVVQGLFQAFGAGDITTILNHLAEDVTIDFYGPPVIPYAGHYAGLEDARKFFETVLASVEIHQFDPLEFIAKGDNVIVTGELELTAKSTGNRFASDFVHAITLRDGKWIWFRDFMNTFVAAEAFRDRQF